MIEQSSEFKFGLSMQNLFDSSIFYGFLMPIEWHSSVATRASYDGVELFPWKIANIQVKSGLVSQSCRPLILSAHQTFRGEQGLREILTHPKPSIALLAALTMPRVDKSPATLAKLQLLLGRDLPLIIYPETNSESLSVLKNSSQKLFQPVADHLKYWDLSSSEKIEQGINSYSVSGLCLDLFHIRKGLKRYGLPTWEKLLPILLPFTKEIHVSAGRIDIAQNEVDTINELRALYSANPKAEICKMLAMIKELRWKGLVVTEIPGRSINLVLKKPKKVISQSQLITFHNQILQMVKGILLA